MLAQKGSQFYPLIEIKFGKFIHVCEWVGLACLLVGVFFAIRNYFSHKHVSGKEKGAVTIISKVLGRSLD